ncbi:type I-F CRISPR-associated protein Csy2 [Proteus sp. ZN5]|uniref:type I-F CRISPR-associated protein Csy2 n=1 Tax=Proteus sp. ZN5 TaxID=2697019 RepID=UPI0013E1C133|nr:type I-F CRISPR-associated protein Csy2 [Proteus sp. ZN5]QIG05460.1 type I-F CRISPR-associated protein Csy2 [Proteus sp. ZN5]
MKHYLLLKKIDVQNANAIAGLTYGFPAITNFLGFAHALSRKLSPILPVSLGGVAVVSHKNDVHVRRPSGMGDYVFALTRNPLTPQGNTAPINEEGRMWMQISLLIEVDGIVGGDKQTEQNLLSNISRLVPAMRLAGGQITNIESIQLLTSEKEQQYALRRLMPGFVLVDRCDYLAAHFQHLQQQNISSTLMDAWCDFATLKFRAISQEDENTTENGETRRKANWEYQPKPNSGYLVPIATGYCAISECYAPGQVANVRDPSIPATFAETAYSVGEWLSVHRLVNIQQGIWRYHHEYPWYLAKGLAVQEDIPEPDTIKEAAELTDFDPDFI